MKKFLEVLLSRDSLASLQGIEAELMRRRQASLLGLLLAALGATLQLTLSLFKPTEVVAALQRIVEDPLRLLLEPLTLGVLLTLLGVFGYFLLRRTAAFMREAQEPFRYSFWVGPFGWVEETPGERFTLDCRDRLALLQIDIRERLDRRIRRFSLLETAPDEGAEQRAHFHIEGQIALREDKREWVIHVVPTVRIGGAGSAAAIGFPVHFRLNRQGEGAASTALSAEEYDQLVERVYSSVATEIYRKIDADVRGKIRLFPTRYLRAVALTIEAEDFARSNTVDAYDRAVALYEEALRFYQTALRRPLYRALNLPIAWRLGLRFQQRMTQARLGHVKCLIFRRILSAFSGRGRYPLFTARSQINAAVTTVDDLNRFIAPGDRSRGAKAAHKTDTRRPRLRLAALRAFLGYPPDDWTTALFRSRLDEASWTMHRRLRFDAHVLRGLCHAQMDAHRLAREDLDMARAIDPELSQRSSSFHLALAVAEPALARRIPFLRRAVELAPEGQIPRFLLASTLGMQFRRDEILDAQVAHPVLEEYDRVLRINPGNIAALAAQGYLYWLCGDLQEAARKYEEGLALKEASSETFVGEIHYGLARVRAEEGRLDEALTAFRAAIEADPSVAVDASGGKVESVSAFEFIGPTMLRRFLGYKDRVRAHCDKLGAKADPKAGRRDGCLAGELMSHVLTDVGNACWNYSWRLGDLVVLDTAEDLYHEALRLFPANIVAKFALFKVIDERDGIERAFPFIEEARNELPSWQVATIAYIQNYPRARQSDIADSALHPMQATPGISAASATGNVFADQLNSTRGGEVPLKVTVALQAFPRAETGRSVPNLFDAKAAVPAAEVESQSARPAPVEEVSMGRRIEGTVEDRLTGGEDENPDVEQELWKKAWKEAVKTGLGNTNLSALLELEIDVTGGGLRELFSGTRPKYWQRLDESEVDLLRAWAASLLSIQEVLMATLEDAELDPARRERTKTEGLDALKVVQEVCELIEHDFYPDDFDCQYLLERVYAARTKLGNLPAYERALDKHRTQVMADRIRYWAVYDPLHAAVYKHWLPELERIAPPVPAAASSEPTAATLKRDFLRRSLAYWAEADPADYGQWHWADSAPDLLDHAVEYRDKPALRRFLSALQHQLEGDRAMDDRQAEEYGRALAAWDCWLQDYPRSHAVMAMQARALSRVSNHEAIGHYRRREYAVAAKCFREAVAVLPTDVVLHSNLALALEDDPAPGNCLERLSEAARALRTAIDLNQAARGPQEKKEDYAERYNRIVLARDLCLTCGEAALARPPALTPLAVEIGRDWIPRVEGEADQLHPAMAERVTAWRNGFHERYGVRLPGIRFRGNDLDLPGDSFIVMIGEVPLVMNTAQLDRQYCPNAALIGQAGSDGVLQSDPLDAGQGVWLAAQAADQARALGLELLTPEQFLLRQVEACVMQRIPAFVGRQELLWLYREAGLDEAAEHLRANTRLLSRLAHMARLLLAETIPIRHLQDLYAAAVTGESIAGGVERYRASPAVRAELPGRGPAYRRLRIGVEFATALRQGLAQGGGELLALAPERAQSLLAALRAALNDQAGDARPAVVVADTRLRLPLRRLCDAEWPGLPVLAETDLDGPIEWAGEIEVDAE